MNTENVTPVSEELTSPRFDTLATNRAHPVVPLSNTSAGMRGMLSGIRHARPVVLVVAAILVAAVIVAAATAIYRHQQSALVTGSEQGSDSIAPAASLPVEDASLKRVTSVPAARRRANSGSTPPSVPLRSVAEQAEREEVLGRLRQILPERSRSRGERGERGDREGKHRDRRRGKDKRGGKDGDDH